MTHLPGLSFDLGETIDMRREKVRSFAADEIAPRAAAIERDNLFPADCGRSWASSGCTA
jgi:isovaleryl-CoA dehydrogenase